jgi:hypothetical protein
MDETKHYLNQLTAGLSRPVEQVISVNFIIAAVKGSAN